MRNRRRLLALCWLVLAPVMLLYLDASAVPVSASPTSELQLFTTMHPAMGTDFTLYLYSRSPGEAAAVSQEVFDEVDRLEQLLSNYRETSELSRINRNASKEAVTTDPEMLEFLSGAQYWSRVSDGAFDITVGRLMKAWGFYRHSGRIPRAGELAGLRAQTGWQKVQVNTEDRTVRFTSPGVELDPGGIGKGFAVDAAVRILRADKISAALLSAGDSTIYALGAPPGREGWSIVVPGPLPSTRRLSVIVLRDMSLSSADCSRKSFTIRGHRYCHIMDPHTMLPIEGRIQVTVVHPSATASDALSNVIFVQTPKRSLATLKAYAPEARALIVTGDSQHARCTSFRWTDSIDPSECVLN